MPVDPDSLPHDPAILKQMLVDLTTQLDKTQRLLAQLLAAKSGTRSEQLSADQLRLFTQELAQELNVPDAATETEKDSKNDDDVPPGSGDEEQGRPRGRRPLPSHLKRERLEHDLREEEKHCASCNQDLRPMGEEMSERYEYVPAQLLVIEDICKKYACACTVKTATKPPQPIEKSTAGASLLAQVIVSKIADHVPVHRQAKILKRFGVDIADQTMCGWMQQSAELLDPLYVRLKQFVLSSKVVGTDDTPVKVLDRSLVRTTRKGRFWPYLGDRNHGAAVFVTVVFLRIRCVFRDEREQGKHQMTSHLPASGVHLMLTNAASIRACSFKTRSHRNRGYLIQLIPEFAAPAKNNLINARLAWTYPRNKETK